jgi:hypothetical protein
MHISHIKERIGRKEEKTKTERKRGKIVGKQQRII